MIQKVKKIIRNHWVLLIAFFILISCYYFYYKFILEAFPDLANDVWWYLSYANSFFREHLVPYTEFRIEYPPLALLDWIIPIVSIERDTFLEIFNIQNVLISFIIIIIVYALLRKSNRFLTAFTLALCLGIFFPISLLRIDIFVSLITVLAAFFFYQYLKIGKVYLGSIAWVLLVVGTFTKLYPVLLGPVLLIFDLKKKNYKKLLIHCISSTIIALPLVIFIVSNFEGFRTFLDYHSTRPLEFESVMAGFLLMGEQLFKSVNMNIVYSYQSYNIDNPISYNLASISWYIMLFLLILSYIYTWIRLKKGNDKFLLLINSCSIVINIFVLTNKVFSTQYFLWMVPFLALQLSFVKKKSKMMIYCIILILISALSIMVYPVLFLDILERRSPAVLLLFIKNIFLVFLNVILFNDIDKVILNKTN